MFRCLYVIAGNKDLLALFKSSRRTEIHSKQKTIRDASNAPYIYEVHIQEDRKDEKESLRARSPMVIEI